MRPHVFRLFDPLCSCSRPELAKKTKKNGSLYFYLTQMYFYLFDTVLFSLVGAITVMERHAVKVLVVGFIQLCSCDTPWFVQLFLVLLQNFLPFWKLWVRMADVFFRAWLVIDISLLFIVPGLKKQKLTQSLKPFSNIRGSYAGSTSGSIMNCWYSGGV